MPPTLRPPQPLLHKTYVVPEFTGRTMNVEKDGLYQNRKRIADVESDSDQEDAEEAVREEVARPRARRTGGHDINDVSYRGMNVWWLEALTNGEQVLHHPKTSGKRLMCRAARNHAPIRQRSPQHGSDWDDSEVAPPRKRNSTSTRTQRQKCTEKVAKLKDLDFSRVIRGNRIYLVDRTEKEKSFQTKLEDCGPVLGYMLEWHDAGGGVNKKIPSMTRFLCKKKEMMNLQREMEEWLGED
jgi:hypothetical protein